MDELEVIAQLEREDEFGGFSQEDRDLEEREIAEEQADVKTN